MHEEYMLINIHYTSIALYVDFSTIYCPKAQIMLTLPLKLNEN